MNSLDVGEFLKKKQLANPGAYLDFYDILNETGFSKDELDRILRDYQKVKVIKVFDYADNVPSKFLVIV